MKKKLKFKEATNDLHSVDELEFRKVWDVVKHTYDIEHHFNTLEIQYRILASHWLLGALAGIGFILVSTPELPFNKLWLVVVIACTSAVGIFQLWRMDIVVYQRLLRATFNEGLKLEDRYQFLPRIKSGMKDSVPGKNVTYILIYYYYISIAFFTLLGLVSAEYLLWESLPGPAVIAIAFIIVLMLIIIHEYMVMESVNDFANDKSPNFIRKALFRSRYPALKNKNGLNDLSPDDT